VRYQHIAALAFDQPLMIEPTKGRIIAHYLASRILGTMVLPDLRGVGEMRPARREGLQVENGIALIDVSGVLVNRAGQMDADSAPLLSYEQLTSEIEAAAADASIRGILLRLDSPGGEVGGVFDLAQRIRQVEKPIWGIAAAQACSAAYLLGCATQRFFTSQEATTGSIGVVLNRFDVTKALDAEGIQVIQIAAGARKLDGSQVQPWKPGSDEEKALVSYVTSFYDLFVNAVATYRGLSAAAVRATDAGVFVGQASVSARLADEVGTIRGTLQKFSETLNNPMRSPIMSAQNADTPAAPTVPPVAAAPAPAPVPSVADPAQLRREGAEAERQRIERITALALPSYEQLAAKAKADGTTVEAFAVLQAEAQKQKSKAKLGSLRADEAALDAPAPVISGDAGGADEATAAAEIIGLHRAMRGQPALGRGN
jgi:signal peptide peptidase SppA